MKYSYTMEKCEGIIQIRFLEKESRLLKEDKSYSRVGILMKIIAQAMAAG